MKIAFDATALYGRFGGIENALWHTFSHLRALDGENQYLVFVPRDAPAPPPPHNPRWEWRRLPFEGRDKARRIFWQQIELPLTLRREKCDLLHAWNYVAPLACPVPFVLTVQDLIALNRPRFAARFNRAHYRAVMPRSLKLAARVIVTAEQTRREVLQRAPDAQVRVIPLGVEPQFFETLSPSQIEAVRAQYALPPRYLLYVGNFEPKKNLPNLLRALEMLPDAPPLVVAGGIKPWAGFEQLLSKAKKIGFVQRDELPALYAGCAVFCFPSLAEGFGLPILEALACGAPVLASTAVPLPHLESVAALAHPRFARSIAEHLDVLLNAEASPQMAQPSRDYARRFSWEGAARATLDVYREFR
ncbi:MAG: glycosyltransferase family 4 protein [Armatimonadetes bacterium]|nr:glycosyltransferase family 4 protein [Armatimonadota bacterium]